MAVRNAAAGVHATALTPVRLFVAWNGVLTIAFGGFPPGLADVKERLEKAAAAAGLPPESPGSKWPKTTLAAARDDAPPLSLRQLAALRDLCGVHDASISAAGADDAGPAVPVRTLSVADYEARSLEVVAARIDVPLAEPATCDPPSEVERGRVAAVLSEWDEDLGRYLERVNMPGSRAASYREESPRGASLVAFWGCDGENVGLLWALEAFRRDVDALLPGRYRWHDHSSLHCTLRSLGPEFLCARDRFEEANEN